MTWVWIGAYAVVGFVVGVVMAVVAEREDRRSDDRHELSGDMSPGWTGLACGVWWPLVVVFAVGLAVARGVGWVAGHVVDRMER